MRLESLYKKAVEVGIDKDLRGKDEVLNLLADEGRKFEKLSAEEKEFYDKDRLFNPYADTRILFGNPEMEVKKAIIGIDMEIGEVLLSHLLNAGPGAGNRIDLIIAHHPEGYALAQLHDVMKLQSDLLAAYGITTSVAEQLMEKRISEIERRLLPVNHQRAVDAARVLGIPMMCIHTPADNCVTRHLRDLFEESKPAKLKDIIDLLRAIPEYKRSASLFVPPKIVSGSESNKCGKIFVDMTGGTEGAKEMFEKHAAFGVSTLVGMHFSEEALESAKKAHLNIVIAGHIASDNLGLNLLLDEVEKTEPLEFVSVSGFERMRRPGA